MPVTVHPIDTGMSWCYLVADEGGVVLVDAGAPGKENLILERLRALGRADLRLVYITHAHLDHYGSAFEVRRLTGAPIAVHEADADDMSRGKTRLGSVRLWGHLTKVLLPIAPKRLRPPPTKPDITVREGDSLAEFGVNAEVLHTPGHTKGSTSLIVDRRLLFVGDLVSNTIWPHPQLLYAHSWDQLGESIRRLQSFTETEWVYSGHGSPPLSVADFARIRAR